MRPVAEQVNSLTIRDAAGMVLADQLLSKCSAAEKAIEERIDKILKPLNSAVTEIRKFKRELLRPIEQAEMAVREKMSEYREREKAAVAEAEDQRRHEEEAIRQQQATIQKKVDEAKTLATRRLLENRLLQSQAKLAEIQAQPEPAPVVLAGSTSRTDKKVTVTDMLAFLIGIGAGKIPLELVSINQVALNRAYKEDPVKVMRWPGVQIEEETVIVRR